MWYCKFDNKLIERAETADIYIDSKDNNKRIVTKERLDNIDYWRYHRRIMPGWICPHCGSELTIRDWVN